MSAEHVETIVPATGSSPATRTLFGYLTETHPRLDRVQNAISGVCAAVSAIAIVVMTLLTGVEVVARAFFDTPLGWNIGLTEQYLMMSMAFFGTVTAYRSGAHVAVVTLFERFPSMVRKGLLILTYVIVLTALCWLMFSGTNAAVFSFVTDEAPAPGMSELALPTWWWKSIIPAAAALGSVVVTIDLYRELSSPLTTVVTDYEPGTLPEGE